MARAVPSGRSSAVQDALKCLVLLHGDTVRRPCRHFWQALRIEDERTRMVTAHECLEQITRHFRRKPGVLDVPDGREHLRDIHNAW